MNYYLIERTFGHVTEEEVAAGGSRSKECAAHQFAGELVWHQSYVRVGDDGLGTVCVYEATSEEAIRAHAEAAGIPCDLVTPVGLVTPEDFS